MRDFTRIHAWQLADDFTVAVYQETRLFPKWELYGLTAQLRRAAQSVAANIAEGAGRGTKKDYLHFLYIARGSLSEARHFVHLARRLGYIDDPISAALEQQGGATFACLHGLIRAVEAEVGKRAPVAAMSASAAITFWAFGLWSLVFGRWSPVSSL